ncbi:MAG: hypothetical protein GX353_09910 [Oligella ureolytica]|jgi:hypothetical protein|nr:hypothetical protein [Oligella ureolytica]HHT83985.1 hypothetical protein [Clostridiales bacterium]
MKKSLPSAMLIIIIILITLAMITAATTFAIWIERAGESKYLQYKVSVDNATIRYQIYVPLDAQGQRIEGSLNVPDRVFTLARPSDKELIDGYALVGWDGGVNAFQLIIPQEHTMKIDDTTEITEITKPPKKVLVIDEFWEYWIAGNDLIEEIIIYDNIIHIDAGAFQRMSSLSSLKLHGESDIVIGDYAFGLCPKLNFTQYDTQRRIIGNLQKIFFRS